MSPTHRPPTTTVNPPGHLIGAPLDVQARVRGLGRRSSFSYTSRQHWAASRMAAATEAGHILRLVPDRPADTAWLKLGAKPGLCGDCIHAKINETRRGTAYLRCMRAAWD